ncbi:MAG: iron-sulfur cluster assembly scaffold protein [Deltaproteobacteria bacterium]|nr:iron-sulfur cluster assembly scaffold protein [Candidatus Anaeroferrophillus wilburensis]MBN2888698.1 iron-sulfur cluster assembly scaffold protein [Deltaproteobacteria bacterium]
MMNEQVIDHFTKPRNMGRLTRATVVGQGGDPGCGDYVELYLLLENDHIIEVSAMVYGCPYAIATTSVFTELVKGKSLDDALEVDGEAVVGVLGEVPEAKRHCSLMGPEALKHCVSQYILQRICTPCTSADD